MFVADLRSGTTQWIDPTLSNMQSHYNPDNEMISADGRYVAFASTSPEVTEGSPQVFVRDLRLGTTRRVSVGGRPGGAIPEHAQVAQGLPGLGGGE
ncbi:MAG: hypothetical protein LC749_14545 [Actinobacteria bacterium]|nr:hypothetical protein [Actinomycetota bacterium]